VESRRVAVETATAWIHADRSRIEQIISNLLDNALKFSAADSVVTIRVSKQGENACLQVADQGAGMTPELMERAFDLFVQSEQGLARSSGGMGIGLALVKRLTELQGGSVAVHSDGEGKGTVFSVRLPSAAPAEMAPKLSITTVPVSPCRILLIEDNEDMRRTIAASLALYGHEVCEAADGRTALELATDIIPDVAIIDIGLPEIDGYDVARRLRKHATTKDIGLVALTGYGQSEDKRNATAAGFDEHLTKPVDADDLLKTISVVRSRRNKERLRRSADRPGR
jgi:CheY-like chemotaxis protein/anti-sigma regulatory factor (Ser/Thr protein kinase)